MADHHYFDIKNPEFTCTAPCEVIGMEASVAVSDPKSGYKSDRFSTLRFKTDNIGGYPMRFSVRKTDGDEWFTVDDIGEIYIQFAGDYEANVLTEFFRHAGALMTLTYGTNYNFEEEQA